MGKPSVNDDMATLVGPAPPKDGGEAEPRPVPGRMTSRTLGGLFWLFLGTGSQAVLQVLVLAVLSRLLAPADFGLVAAVLAVVGFSTIFSQLGIGPAVVQRLELKPAHLRMGFTLSLLLGFLLAALAWMFAPAVADCFRLPGLTPILRAVSLVFPLQGLSVVAESLLQRDLQFRRLAAIEVASVALGYGLVGIALAALGFGAWSLVGGHLAQTVLKTAALLILRPHPMRPLWDRQACSELLYFGSGFTVARVGNYLGTYGDNFVIGRWLGAAALGIYGRAYQLVAGPAALFGTVLDRVLFPAMARVQTQPEQLAAAYRRGVALIALVTLPASAVLVVLAPELIHVLLGPGWDAVVVPFQILAAGLMFRTSYRMSDSISRATAAVYRRAWRQGLFALMVVGGAWLGCPWGLAGVSVGVAVAITMNFLLMAQLSLTLASMSWQSFWAAHLPAVTLAALLGGPVWACAVVLRACALPPLVVLLLSAAAALPFLFVARSAPRLFLGRDGCWMLRTVGGYVPRAQAGPFRRTKEVVRWLTLARGL
jgi:O-antigen/teichoic acid export membrane protein